MALRSCRPVCRRLLERTNTSSASLVRPFTVSHQSRRADVVDDTPLVRKHVVTPTIYPKYFKSTSKKDHSVSKAQSASGRKRSSVDQVVQSNSVEVTINGEQCALSPILLRDLCTCPHCVDSSTKQKHFCTTDIPSDIKGFAEPTASGIQVAWENDIPGYTKDHRTELSFDLLTRLFKTGRTAIQQEEIPRVLWDSHMYESQGLDFDYASYMNDDTVLLQALRQLQSHGLLFITNVPEDENSVETLASRVGPLKTTFYGKTWDVRSVPDAINVAYTSQNLGFHMDLMYMEQPPHLQLLHCIRSSAAGGASLFTDSFKAAADLAELDGKAFGQLSDLSTDFHYDHPGSNYYHQSRKVIEQKWKMLNYKRIDDWHHYTQQPRENSRWAGLNLKPIDFIENVSWSPPFQAPFSLAEGNNSAVPSSRALSRTVERWHAAAKKFNQLVHRPEGIYERLMKPGECVIFDNRRVLHARKAFEVGDAGTERWLRGAYIDKDPFVSKLRILTELHGGASKSTIENDKTNYFEDAASDRQVTASY